MCDTCPSGRSGSGSQRASVSCSQQSLRNAGGGDDGYAVPLCMKPCPPEPSCNQARPDCCQIPCEQPPLPKCPLGLYVKRVQPIRPDRHYEPPTIPFDALSSYREQFTPRCSDRAVSYKPQSTFEPSTAPMNGLSTYRETYVLKPLVGYQKPPWSVAARFDPSPAKMDGITTYRYDYKGCMTDRVVSVKPLSTFDPSTAKMEGVSTYRVSFIPYCNREYQYAKQGQYNNQTKPEFSTAPFDGLSTYRSDYWAKCSMKRKSMKPTNKARFSDAKFAGCTTYRNDYNPFHFQKCVPPCEYEMPIC